MASLSLSVRSEGNLEYQKEISCGALQETHPYEEPAFDVYARQATPLQGGFGMGRIGALPAPMSRAQLVAHVKQGLGLATLMVAAPNQLSEGIGGASGTEFQNKIVRGRS